MPTQDDTQARDVKAVELALDEQRRDYDILHGLHEANKIKNITFLAAALGILAYLYTGKEAGDIEQRLFIPSEPYGVVFYVVGISLLLGAVTGFMIVLIKNRKWHTAYEDSQEESLMNDYKRYLLHTHGRYLTVSKNNGRCYEARRYLLNNSFMAMILGATILLLIKTLEDNKRMAINEYKEGI